MLESNGSIENYYLSVLLCGLTMLQASDAAIAALEAGAGFILYSFYIWTTKSNHGADVYVHVTGFRVPSMSLHTVGQTANQQRSSRISSTQVSSTTTSSATCPPTETAVSQESTSNLKQLLNIH